MNMKRATFGIVAAYLASMVLVAFAPMAAAQGEPKLVVIPDGTEIVGDNDFKAGGRLKPEVSVAQIKFKWKVEVPATAGCILPVTVVYSAKPDGPAASWASVIIDKGQEARTYTDEQSSYVSQGKKGIDNLAVTMTVTTSRDAPAFFDGRYTVTAQAKVGGSTSAACRMAESDVASVPYQVKNDYLARMAYEPSTYIQKTGQNKKLSFGITMTNLGNGLTKVDTLVDQTSKNKLDAVLPPGQQLVPSKAGNPQAVNKQETQITVQTPHSNGYTNTFYSLKATFKAASDNSVLQGLTTDEKSLNLSVQVQGVYVPGFDPTMVIAALGVGLLMLGGLRRRTA